ncbi:MAG: Protein often near L-alanine-DL-glutamate epimerase (cell wall recycling) [uncultured Cytophagales bacterium]|uniref:Protein often near L-alanine-DL-glutamate epimerase (Cell wall recycling) n=1 Tax=uncultured Cytophagales bacterium TaxID=158755 RepID=A0A6J4IZZ7_9SPHI|nr:MAG: Protein often near L-alanine-DL-glutamate epimerase (cell wall recycling) [uncultured Cytophagales bacterium]
MEGTALVLTNNQLGKSNAKTSHGLIRGSSRYQIIGVIDEASAGKDAGEVLDGIPRNIPVFATLADATGQLGKVDYCLVGVATKGGKLPPEMQGIVMEALSRGISVVNGLHEAVGDKPEVAALAAQSGARVLDIRKPKPKDQLHFWTGRIKGVTAPRVAVLGTDCNLGKRTTARLLTQACREAGMKAEMIYTGQTGWMQGGRYGFIFDCTPNDFVSGEVEHAIVTCFEEEHPDVMFIEGQSSLRNPSGPCGSEFLVSGEARYVVLQHAPGRTYFDDNEKAGCLIPPLGSEVELIRFYGAEVIAITLNTQGLTEAQAKAWQGQYESELGLPVVRPLEEGVGRIVKLVEGITGKAR